MSNNELAPNPQNPDLFHTLQATAELINVLATGSNLEVPVPGAIYRLHRDRAYSKPEPGRQNIQLAWANSGYLVASDNREVASMILDVPQDLDAANREPVQTYRFAYLLLPKRWHTANITIDNTQQQVSIAEDRPDGFPPHWQPLSDPDIENMLTVFHDALQEAKFLEEELTREIAEHNELLKYIKTRWPNGFPHGNSLS